MGCVLRPGYDLPPPMFTVEEVETIVLGARLSRDRGDADRARAADDVLAKVAAVLPPPLAAVLGARPFWCRPARPTRQGSARTRPCCGKGCANGRGSASVMRTPAAP
jgi:predicted DNA-binding transcriptional regulator YafY